MDYHVFFRDRSFKLQEHFKNDSFCLKKAVTVPVEIIAPGKFCGFATQNFPSIKEYFIDILLSPHSSKILFALYCCPAHNAHSILTKLSPSLEAIAYTVRGGANLYKLNGWMVHVLIGYSIVTDYLPKGDLPPTLAWSYNVKAFIKNTAQVIYKSLNETSRLILHASMLGHDIGISKEITDHDIHGVPLVPAFLKEINITGKILKDNHHDVPYEDFLWAVQAVVRYHTFINRIGVEYSIQRSQKEIETLLNSAESKPWRDTFLRKDFISIIFLVAIGDLIAVDDTLFSERKTQTILKGYDTLLSIFPKESYPTDKSSAGFHRFKNFLSDENLEIQKKDADEEIDSFGYSPDDFWGNFFAIEEFNFTLSLVPFLPSAIDTLFVFLLIFLFIDRCLGSKTDVYEKTRIIFDHSIKLEVLSSQISQLRTTFTGDKYPSIKDNCWKIGKLEFLLLQDPEGQLISVRIP